MANKIKVALIGCGYWGNNLFRVIQNSFDAQLVTVCDTDSERINALAAQNPTITFTDNLHQVIADTTVDAAVVCTPVSTHFAITSALLQAGKHVLCEKPLTDSVHTSRQLQQIAALNNRILLIGHVFEYHSVMQHMKKLLAAREAGDIQYLQFNRMGLGAWRTDVNVIFDLAAHDVGMAISLVGQPPLAVTASGPTASDNKPEAVAFMQLEFPNKVFANINVSWVDPIKQRLVKVVGNKKMLVFDDISTTEKLKIIETGTNYQTHTGDFGSFQLSVKDGDIVIPNLHHPEPLVVEFNHFMQCIRGQQQPLTNGVYATQVVCVLEAAQQSLRQNGEKVWLA